MPITNAGVALIATILNSTLAAGAWIGVGDSTTVFNVSQTDLQASSNVLRKTLDGGFPSISGDIITLQSTFSTTDANFAWQEWGVFNAASAGTMVNRKVESLGTKTSSQSWQLQVTLTLSAS